MKGVVVPAAGAPFEVVDGIEQPQPGQGQILVKSIIAAINPVETYQQSMGMLVDSWPVVLGCDAGGVVVELGPGASKFKIGDEVCGCTRLGVPGYSTFQEYFLMDADLTIKKPKNISLEQAATLGVGTYTACLGLFRSGFGIPLINPKTLPESKDEWIIVLGGAASVGQYAVQFAKLAGYKVLASCSSKSAQSVKSLGADETIDYKKSEDEQLKDVSSITGGKFSKIYDTVAKSSELALKMLKELSQLGEKQYATTDDWSNIAPVDGIKIHRVQLGAIGKSDAAELNGYIASYVPMIEDLVEAGKLIPNDYQIIGQVGLESVIQAWKEQQKNSGAGGKYLARIQSP